MLPHLNNCSSSSISFPSSYRFSYLPPKCSPIWQLLIFTCRQLPHLTAVRLHPPAAPPSSNCSSSPVSSSPHLPATHLFLQMLPILQLIIFSSQLTPKISCSSSPASFSPNFQLLISTCQMPPPHLTAAHIYLPVPASPPYDSCSAHVTAAPSTLKLLILHLSTSLPFVFVHTNSSLFPLPAAVFCKSLSAVVATTRCCGAVSGPAFECGG
jgi:hypothetical protein